MRQHFCQSKIFRESIRTIDKNVVLIYTSERSANTNKRLYFIQTSWGQPWPEFCRTSRSSFVDTVALDLLFNLSKCIKCPIFVQISCRMLRWLESTKL